jgi:hypothetical protein
VILDDGADDGNRNGGEHGRSARSTQRNPPERNAANVFLLRL